MLAGKQYHITNIQIPERAKFTEYSLPMTQRGKATNQDRQYICHKPQTSKAASSLFTIKVITMLDDSLNTSVRQQTEKKQYPVSILYKSIAGRYRPVRVADGPITARYSCIKNASWVAPELPPYNGQ